MEAASLARRERLAALKKRKLDGAAPVAPRQRAADGDDEELAPEEMDAASLVRTFRNYDQSTGQAKRAKLGQIQDTIENEVQGVQEGIIAADELKRQEELDLTNIAPKKPNWDLKRDMEKRLAKLERRDKEARLVLIRQRVQAAQAAGEGQVAGQLSAQEAELAASTLGAGIAGPGALERGAGSDDDGDSDDE